MNHKFSHLYQNAMVALAVFITLLGTFFLLDWFFGLSSLLNPPPSEWPMPYSAAWCIFLGGLGFLAILFSFRFFIQEICGALITLFSLLRFCEILFEHNLGLDWFFRHLLTYSPANFLPMAFLGAIGFLLTGLILLLWPRNPTYKTKGTLIITLTSILIWIGFVGTLWYFLPYHVLYGWRDRLPINFYSAIAQILLGWGFLIHRFHIEIYKKSNAINWTVFFIPTLIVMFTILLNIGLSESTKATIEARLKSRIRIEKLIYITKINNSIEVLASMTNQIEHNETLSDTSLIFKNNPEINRIFWTDQNFIIQEEVPRPTGVGLPTDIATILHDNISQNIQKKIFAYLNPENRYLFLFSHIIRNNQFNGACIVELNLSQIFNLMEDEFNDFTFIVRYKNDIIFSSPAAEKIKSMHISNDISIDNQSLNFTIYPTKNLLEFRLNHLFETIILLGSIFLSVSLGYLIYLLNSWLLLAQKKQRILHFSEELLKAFNKTEKVQDACRELMTLVNQLHPWNMLVLWEWNTTDHLLKCSDVIYNDSIQFPNFEQFVIKTLPTETKNLEWQVFNERKAIALGNLSIESDYICSLPASQDHIQGAIAFPIFEREQPSGVILILKKDLFLPEFEPEIIDLLPSIGIQMGQFIQRKKFEKAQKEIKDIFLYSTEAIFSLDLNGIVKSWNPGAEKIYGWTAAEMIGQNIFDKTFLPEDREELTIRKQTIHDGKPIFDWEGQRQKKDDSLIWLSINLSPIFDEFGKPIGTVAICHDISEQKRISLELAKSEEKYRSFIDTTDEWIWETNAAFQYTYSNSSVQKMLGYEPKELVGIELFFILPEEDQNKVKTEMELCLKNKTGWQHRVISLKKKNGSICWIESTGMPFVNQKGEISGFRGVNRNITEEIKTEQSKNEFISIVSHELRTPLTSIMGAIGLLTAEKDLSAKNHELITLAARNCERLAKLINDILDIEKMQLSKLELRMQPLLLLKPVRDAIDLAKPMAEQLHVRLVEGPMIDNLKVNADYDRLIQIMLNLLSNAIKFSPAEGKVTIWMEQVGDRARVSVRDEGKGIPIELQPHIFEKFKKIEISEARIAGGSGLGLNISKSLIELMGGTIHFTTEQNVGAVFYFELPMQD